MAATILLARRPEEANESWLRRSLVALALRFRDARVRLLLADAEASGAAGGVRPAPPPASFDTVVVIERVKARWSAGPASTSEQREAVDRRGVRGEARLDSELFVAAESGVVAERKRRVALAPMRVEVRVRELRSAYRGRYEHDAGAALRVGRR